MALNANDAAAEVVAALKSRNPDITGDQESQLTLYWEDIMGAIFTHITSNAQVMSNGVTGSGTPGGPLPITGLNGDIS